MRDYIEAAAVQAYTPRYPSVSEHTTSRGWARDIFDFVRKVEQMKERNLSYGWRPGAHTGTLLWVPLHQHAFAFIVFRRAFEGSIRFERRAEVKELPRNTFDIVEDDHVATNDVYRYSSKPFEGQKRFVPSRDLTGLWLDGIRAHIESSPKSDEIKAAIAEPSLETARSIFATRFSRMLATLGNRVRYGEEETSILCDREGFTVTVQHTLLERFHIVPARSSSFFFLLSEELYAFIDGGGTASGDWGSLIRSDSDLVFRCEAPPPSESAWDQATVIE